MLLFWNCDKCEIVTILIEVLTLCNSIILLNIFFFKSKKSTPLWIVRRRYLRSGPCYSSVGHPAVLETLLKTLLKILLRFQQSYWIDLLFCGRSLLAFSIENARGLPLWREAGRSDSNGISACLASPRPPPAVLRPRLPFPLPRNMHAKLFPLAAAACNE